jgi:hypothetical protein
VQKNGAPAPTPGKEPTERPLYRVVLAIFRMFYWTGRSFRIFAMFGGRHFSAASLRGAKKCHRMAKIDCGTPETPVFVRPM